MEYTPSEFSDPGPGWNRRIVVRQSSARLSCIASCTVHITWSQLEASSRAAIASSTTVRSAG